MSILFLVAMKVVTIIVRTQKQKQEKNNSNNKSEEHKKKQAMSDERWGSVHDYALAGAGAIIDPIVHRHWCDIS